jgi:general stress protein 26
MRVSSFADLEAEFIERAHRMVWCDMATVGPDGRPRTRIVHPVWDGDTAWMTSLRVGPKAEDIDRNPYISLAYVIDPLKPAYAECVASWVDDRDERIAIWERIAAIPEPLGYNAQIMFGGYDVPNLTLLRLEPWKIRLTVAGDVSPRRIWEQLGRG